MRAITPYFIAVSLLFAALPAHAQTRSAYFVQLGNAASEEEAATKWDTLREQFPAVLDKLRYVPRTVVSVAGGESEYRIQAGPARSREQAQRICSTLSAKDVECFIVETAVFEGEPSYTRVVQGSRAKKKEIVEAPAVVEEVKEAAPVELAEAPKLEPVPEPFVEDSKPLPWKLSSREEQLPQQPSKVLPDPISESKPEPAPEPARVREAKPAPAPEPKPEPKVAEERFLPKGRVEVAEAIPVPLSNMGGSQPTSQVSQRGADVPLAQLRGQSEWLQLSGFASEQAAFDFSQALHVHIGDRGALRMRVTRSLMGRAQPRSTTLSVGPVKDASTAAAICDFAPTYDANITCGNTVAQQQASGSTSIAQGTYAEPISRAGSTPRRVSAAPASSTSAYQRPPTIFWAQLGSWKNRAEALYRWEALEQKNRDLLGTYDPNIGIPPKMSLNAKPSARLRVGPFDGRLEAESLCGRLGARGVSCIVVPE